MAPRKQLAVVAPQVGRRLRSPQHPFQLSTRPFQIQPFMIAPVLPGETLKSLLMQSRVVTDPILNSVVGWWKEYYFFYIKHRDLDDRAAFEQMMLNPSWDDSAVDDTGGQKLYHHFYGSDINWVDLCLKRVCAGECQFFRNFDEAWNVSTVDNLPVASIASNSVLDSFRVDAVYDAPDTSITVGVDDMISMSELEIAQRTYDFLKAGGMTDMSYEDYLSTYSVRAKPEERHIPELIRMVKQWQYPSNTIDPTNGTPRSAVSWSFAERADKDRFFREPGFLFGVTITRPKVYIRQYGSFTSGLNTAMAWLPEILRSGGDYMSSMRQFPDSVAGGPFDNLMTDTGGYWVDIRDLFMYGEQFTNFLPNSTGKNIVALPLAAGTKRYPSSADMDGLFVSGAANKVREDGVVMLNILGRQQDYTPQT